MALKALAGAFDAKAGKFGGDAFGAVQEALKAAAEAKVDPALEVGGACGSCWLGAAWGVWLGLSCSLLPLIDDAASNE